MIQANGGSGDRVQQGGGGAAGALRFTTQPTTIPGHWQAYGGSGLQRGGAGTIYLKGQPSSCRSWFWMTVARRLGALTTVSNLSQLPRLTVLGGANIRFTDLGGWWGIWR